MNSLAIICRLKSVVTSPVEKSDGRPRPFLGLDDIESSTGSLRVESLELKSDFDSVLHRPGDVLFSKLRPYLAKSYMPPLHGSGTSELIVLRPQGRIDTRFLLYSTLSTPWLDWAEITSYGAKMPRTSWEAMAEYELKLPPMHEQRRIADFLDAETARADSIRRKSDFQRRLIEARFLESMRMKTVGAIGRTAPTGIHWMPFMHVDWSLKKVSREFKTSSGTTPSSSDDRYFGGMIPWVNSSDLRDGKIDRIERRLTREALNDYSALKTQPPGALIVAMYGQGETKGKVGLLAELACLNQACCALIPVGRVLPIYAAYWFRSHKQGVVSLALGAGQPNLSQELIRQLKIPTPSIGEQRQIVQLLESEETWNNRELSSLNRRSKLLTERRTALITAAVTGQIDVTTARGISTSGGVE